MYSINETITLDEFTDLTNNSSEKSNKYFNWPQTNQNAISNIEYSEFVKNPELLVIKKEKKICFAAGIEKLEWDSNFFGYNCAKITLISNPKEKLSDELYKHFSKFLEYFAKKHKIRFMFGDVGSWQTQSGQLLQENGFKYILTWIDGYVNSQNVEVFQPANEEHSFGELREQELDYFRDLSKNQYFKGGRFYFDTRFSEDSVMKMYANLIDFSYKNNNILLVYRINNNPVGIFICKKIVTYPMFSNLKAAHLRFLLLDNNYRGLGIGQNLFKLTLSYLKSKTDIITTGLEVHNIQSLNLHSQLKFHFNYTHNAFHKWYY